MSAELIGQLMSQNARDLAFTTDRIVEGLEAQIETLVEGLLLIERALDAADVIDRKTEDRLRELTHYFDMALMIHEHKRSSS